MQLWLQAITSTRDEIRFIAKYQDSNSGMIWHELSQSAPCLDWRAKYPYLFVHADVTYSYIPAVAEYVRTTNDRAFLREIWPSVEKAFSYCRMLIDADGLPEIPAGKLGMDEQKAKRDALGLSADWILACEEYAALAGLIGDGNAAQQAHLSAQKAKASFANRYWDAQLNFAIQGHRQWSADGGPWIGADRSRRASHVQRCPERAVAGKR